MNDLLLIGRSSSHFTRLAAIFAHELGVPFTLVPVHDLTANDPTPYQGNPAMKVPALCRGDERVFGAENICRTLAEIGAVERRIVWPEQARSAVARNAQEMTWNGMNAQVQLLLGAAHKLPADSGYFTKIRASFEGSLGWLEDHLDEALRSLPEPRDLSLLEVSLFCLLDHIAFRGTLPLAPYTALAHFAGGFARRPSAQRTGYRFDAPPA